MDYKTAVNALWRHHYLGDAGRDATGLVHYAILAASSHNTQPWRFHLAPGRITLLPDLTRRCPAVDPDDHHLYASLGCAAENLVLAAQAAGYHGQVGFDDEASTVGVALQGTRANRSTLFDAIVLRQCSRSEYDGKVIPPDHLEQLVRAARGNGVDVSLLTDPQHKEQVAEYVTAGNDAQFGDAAWLAELKAWVRFSAREAVAAGDGLYGPVMGSPAVPRWLGECFMRFAFSARAQNAKDVRHIRSSPAIAVIHSGRDDKAHWVEAGRSVERLGLQAAALGLRTAFINQPVEVAGIRRQFTDHLGLGARRADFIVRLGYGPMMPRSLRRPVAQVLA